VEVGGKWRALYCVERPGVWFEDVMSITAVGGETSIAVDPLFIQVCEPGSVVVTAVQPESFEYVSARTDGGNVVFGRVLKVGERVHVKVAGMRLGFGEVRMDERTQKEAEASFRKWGG
jgi:hypothetical protein